jgi:NADPH:quinone reductase-like Zn-dependent oxidoreductase
MKGLELSGYGDPAAVVKLVDVPDLSSPEPDEVIIEVEAFPVDPTDLYVIAGVYGELPRLPHLLGCEGVGRVVATGREVRRVKEGDRTLVPPFSNAWAELVRTKASWLRPLPDGDVDQRSLLGINPPTAALLLSEFVSLKAGDWVVQTAANSAVGRSLIPIAKARGLRTINIVRRPELVAELERLGGDVVLVDGPDLAGRIAAATDRAPLALALDGVGGGATQRLLDAMPIYGVLVVWSAMSGDPVALSGPLMVFEGRSVHGFWIVNWLKRPGNWERFGAICEELAPMIASGEISMPIAGVYGLDQHTEALSVASNYRGKAIFRRNGVMRTPGPDKAPFTRSRGPPNARAGLQIANPKRKSTCK